jgi:hypothetical protein
MAEDGLRFQDAGFRFRMGRASREGEKKPRETQLLFCPPAKRK